MNSLFIQNMHLPRMYKKIYFFFIFYLNSCRFNWTIVLPRKMTCTMQSAGKYIRLKYRCFLLFIYFVWIWHSDLWLNCFDVYFKFWFYCFVSKITISDHWLLLLLWCIVIAISKSFLLFKSKFKFVVK